MNGRYNGTTLPTRLLAGDPDNPLAESGYVRRLRRVVFVPGFLALFMVNIVLLHSEEISGWLFGVSITAGQINPVVIAFFMVAYILLLMTPAIVVWVVLHRAMSDWREQLLPQMVLTGQPVEALLFFPARSYLWAGFFAGLLSQLAIFALPTAAGHNTRAILASSGGMLTLAAMALGFIIGLVFQAVGAWITTVVFIVSRGLLDFLFRFLGWSFIIAWALLVPFMVLGVLAAFAYPVIRNSSALVLTACSLVMIALLVAWTLRRLRRLIEKSLERLRAWETTFVENEAGG